MNDPVFTATILTLFPEMFPGPLGHSISGKALKDGIWELHTHQIRDFAKDKHKTVDDTPYGGGAGMVMRPDVIDAAIEHAKKTKPNARLIYFTPRGVPLSQSLAHELSREKLILLCGRYEGVDERVLQAHQPLEISAGDFVLSGGEMAAMLLLDACVRLIPGVVGDSESLMEESFGLGTDFAGLLEYPHYSRPPIWNGRAVPDVLLSGDHAKIKDWRLSEAKKATETRRPDLWKRVKEG
jgi:tRNA (guanine37-N1)-methyltransferase